MHDDAFHSARPAYTRMWKRNGNNGRMTRTLSSCQHEAHSIHVWTVDDPLGREIRINNITFRLRIMFLVI